MSTRHPRRITRLKRSIKAISPVIAALLFVAIAVAAAVLMFSFVTGLLGEQSATAGTNFRIELVDFIVQDDSNPIHDLIKVQLRNTGTTTITVADIKFKGDFTISDFTSTSASTSTTFSDTDPGVTDSPDSALVIAPKELRIFWFDLPVGRDWMVSKLYESTVTTDRGFTVTGTFTSPSKHAIAFFISATDPTTGAAISTLATGQTATITVTSLSGYATTTLSSSLGAFLSDATLLGVDWTKSSTTEITETTTT